MSFKIEPAYQPQKYEDKIYEEWERSGLFTPQIDHSKKPFVISMPPPNATGVLHMGHAAMLAIEDIMVRHNRMKGAPTLWLPGTDSASIATQNKVEQLLAKKGKTKYDLGRKDFLKEVDKYVENSKSVIKNQIRKMGASCDWSREKYTMDADLTYAVEEVFLRMYKDGLIYRGDRIVNWCPRCESTLANDEVVYKEKADKLYWIKYGPFVLATTRPETKLGDTAVAVHPDDKRYEKMIGKKYQIPGVLGEFEITVVGDKEVDPKFGSGAVKVTPAHSFTDFEIAQRHKLPSKSIIDEKGKMKKNCGKYAGMTTTECRKAIVKDMEKMGLIEKIEDFNHSLSICYRCDTTIEPLISKQWFIDVNKPVIKDGQKKKSLKEKSIEVVKNKEIKIVPARFNKTYFNWMENLRDWCISRQIWFGHRIPIWYCKKCNHTAPSRNKPKKCPKCGAEEWKQDPDTLDTWFSSGLWTFSTLGWPKETEDLKYFHPTSVMETGYDIIFFWVARMIIMSNYAMKEIPFQTVYLHGLIRDKNGQKMSKSKPETCIDPLEMIKKYGTDAVRLSLTLGGGAGNDVSLYEEKIAGYRNFVNKIWNGARFTLMNTKEEDFQKEFSTKSINSIYDKWILTRLQELIKETDKSLDNYQFSEAGLRIYNFIWKQYCDWYLEISKGEDRNPQVLIFVLRTVLKLLHPFVPFVTEKLWEYLKIEEKQLIGESWPKQNKNLIFRKEAETVEKIQSIISEIRSIRAEMGIEAAKKIKVIIHVKTGGAGIEAHKDAILRLARLESLEVKEKGSKPQNAKAIFIKDVEIYIPLEGLINKEEELKKLQKELKEKEAFLKVIQNKLKNKGFTEKAPKELVEKEKARSQELELKIQKLKSEIKSLS
jgi:valyl-tRNA synthetase